MGVLAALVVAILAVLAWRTVASATRSGQPN
jgi:hypothetical protein